MAKNIACVRVRLQLTPPGAVPLLTLVPSPAHLQGLGLGPPTQGHVTQRLPRGRPL